MAPFEWLSPDWVMKWWTLVAGFSLLGIGLLTLYGAGTSPDDILLFGVDALLVVGVLQVLLGLGWLLYERELRPPVP